MRVLITGGMGFIGSHLADELLKKGHAVSLVDNLSTGNIDNIKNIKDHMVSKIMMPLTRLMLKLRERLK